MVLNERRRKAFGLRAPGSAALLEVLLIGLRGLPLPLRVTSRLDGTISNVYSGEVDFVAEVCRIWVEIDIRDILQ